MKQKLLGLVFLLVLGGCASVKPAPVVVTNRVFTELPFGLTTVVQPPKPPSISAYTAATEEQREKLLMDTLQEHMDFIDYLVIERVSLKKWAMEQKSIYEQSPLRP